MRRFLAMALVLVASAVIPALAVGSVAADDPAVPVSPAAEEPIWLTNCEYSYQYCLWLCEGHGDPAACELSCWCSYLSCKGMEIPNECIY